MAGNLLPDILLYDPSRPAAYPHNGRALSDDAMDGFISILTNGKVTGDNVGPHTGPTKTDPRSGWPPKYERGQVENLCMFTLQAVVALAANDCFDFDHLCIS